MSISDPLMVRYYELLSDVDLATLARVQRGVNGEADGWHPMDAKAGLGPAKCGPLPRAGCRAPKASTNFLCKQVGRRRFPKTSGTAD